MTTAQTVCFISAKGGSGKTVTSSSLATFLSQLKLRVLLVDMDAATNGLTLLYLQQLLGTKRSRPQTPDQSMGLFEVGLGETPSKIKINEYFDIVPASFKMGDTEDASASNVAEGLRAVIESGSSYDFIFLDAQAGADNFARLAASMVETCVIVSEYDPVSSQGVERLKVLFSDVIEPSETWTLFNKVLPEFTSAIGEGLAVARFLPPIPWDADVVRAFTRRDLAIDMHNPNPYTLSIAQLARELLPDASANKIAAWSKSVSGTLTSPVEDRLENLSALQKQIETARAKERNKIVVLATLAFAAVASTLAILSEYFAKSDSNWFERLYGNWGTVAVMVLLVPFLMDFVTTAVSNRTSDRVATKLLDEERKKLQAALDATNASLRLNGREGYYSQIRRDRIASE